MAIIEITTRLDRRWFERKTKSELISMLMANLDKVDIFAEEYRTELAAATKVIKAARCIRHWHDTQDGGMIVSGPHVHKLWEALEAYDRATTPKES